jgi:molybdopterin-biosynthesis enzyme MoeA-like protein
LRAAAASAKEELEHDRAAFAEEQQLFAQSTRNLSRAVAACRDVQAQTKASAQVLNNKKLDLLKVKVRTYTFFCQTQSRHGE